MARVVLDVGADDLVELAHWSPSGGLLPILRLHGGDPILLLSAAEVLDSTPIDVWLTRDAGYPPQVLARAIKTLTHLRAVNGVIIDGPDAEAAAAIIRRLLSDDVVTMQNKVATLVGATNHPAPPQPVTVWHVDGEHLVAPNAIETFSVMQPIAGRLNRNDA